MRLKVFFVGIFLFLLLPTIVRASVVINEFSSGDTSDWVELYNTSEATPSADLSDYQLQDDGGNTKSLSGTFDPKTFLSIDWSNKLNNAGDKVKLYRISSNSFVNEISYGDRGGVCAATSEQSIGRSTDGTGEFVRFASKTKGSSNTQQQEGCPTPSPDNPTLTSPIPTPYISPAPIPTPTPTPTPKSSPFPISTKKPVSSSRPTGLAFSSTTPSDQLEFEETKVLGIESDVEATASTNESKFPIASFVLIVSGIVFTVLAGVWFAKAKKDNIKIDENNENY